MPFPRKLRRKSEKITLAFEYVHDRFSGLPKYSHLAFSFFRRFGVVTFFALLLILSPFLANPFMRFAREITPKVREVVISIIPKALPEITIGKTARDANNRMARFTERNWQEELESIPLTIVRQVTQIPDLVRNQPEIFEQEIALDFSDLWDFQSSSSTPYGSISLSAGRLARTAALPYATNRIGFPSRIEAEIALLKAIANLNRVDFSTLLKNSSDRRKALEDYLTRGRNLETSGRRNYFNILARRQEAEERDENLETSAREKEQEVFAALNRYLASETEMRFESFVDTRKKTVLSGAEGGLLTALEQKYAQEVNFLSQKLAAIEQNKEALIANVVVTPTPGVDLGLIKVEEE